MMYVANLYVVLLAELFGEREGTPISKIRSIPGKKTNFKF